MFTEILAFAAVYFSIDLFSIVVAFEIASSAALASSKTFLAEVLLARLAAAIASSAAALAAVAAVLAALASATLFSCLALIAAFYLVVSLFGAQAHSSSDESLFLSGLAGAAGASAAAAAKAFGAAAAAAAAAGPSISASTTAKASSLSS